jgi:hypothetical protein
MRHIFWHNTNPDIAHLNGHIGCIVVQAEGHQSCRRSVLQGIVERNEQQLFEAILIPGNLYQLKQAKDQRLMVSQ